jgi:hypothetical protein
MAIGAQGYSIGDAIRTLLEAGVCADVLQEVAGTPNNKSAAT